MGHLMPLLDAYPVDLKFLKESRSHWIFRIEKLIAKVCLRTKRSGVFVRAMTSCLGHGHKVAS